MILCSENKLRFTWCKKEIVISFLLLRNSLAKAKELKPLRLKIHCVSEKEKDEIVLI